MADENISPDFSQLMSDLRHSAEAFHQESASVVEVIEGVEEQLADLDLNLEVWLEGSPLHTRELSVSASSVAPILEVQLGYAPTIRGDWRLHLREAEYAPLVNDESDRDRQLMRVKGTTLLVDAPREDRLAAVGLFTPLLRFINEAVRRRTEMIQQARRLID